MKQRFFQLLFIGLLLSLSINVLAQERYVRPVDEAAKDSSFYTFRTKLIKAVKNKDKKQLILVLDKNLTSSFGGDGGINEFIESWNLNGPNSKLWDELLKALNNGGKFITEGKEKTFCAPYSFWAFPDDLDAFENQVIFGFDVNLRERPNLSSKVITRLSYNVVKIDYEKSVLDESDEPIYSWYKITTLGGKSGYVSSEFVRSPIDYRACFTKKTGQWKMTAFVAGD